MNDDKSFPFEPADTGIDMIEKVPASSGNGTYAGRSNAQVDPVEMARQLSSSIERMMAETEELRAWKQAAEVKLAGYAELSRSYETLHKAVVEVQASELTVEDVAALQQVLQALVKDPNHIMVLASVAQRAGQLEEVVCAFARMRADLNNT